ncbi:9062_t:CDS:2, partial [Entrophospora sp. SA101]
EYPIYRKVLFLEYFNDYNYIKMSLFEYGFGKSSSRSRGSRVLHSKQEKLSTLLPVS